MKKITSLLLLLFIIMINTRLPGQITINQALFPLKAAFQDSLYSASTSSVSVATTGNNQNWDYSNLQKLVLKMETYHDAKDSLAFNALHYYRSDINVLTNPLVSYSFLSIDAQGYYPAGRYTIGVILDLSLTTGSTGDELVIPNQHSYYTTTPYRMKFPANMGANWNFHTVQILDYTVTVDANGLNNTPGTVELHEINQTDVIGSGQITIPDENGNPLPPIDALLLKIKATYIDSIFVNGMPAPAAQLSPFGLVQGARDSIEYYSFYAPGNGQFIASYGLYTQGSISYFNYRPSAARNAAKFMGENEFVMEDGFTIYPVPVNAGDVLNIETEGKEYSGFQLCDLRGNVLSAGITLKRENKNEIIIPRELSSGIYLLSLINDADKVVIFKKIQVIR